LCRAAVAANLGPMEELLRSNDPVYLSFVRHVLDEEAIHHFVLDEHMSVLEGSVGILPRRVLVLREDLERARLALGNATLTMPY
jgi:hypothetical protein